jgi:succinate dehydrogenase / fumarate reductase iron-sulfur subunit
MLKFSIYRYNAETPDIQPHMQEYLVDEQLIVGKMLLDALTYIQENLDATLSFRKSCREGVCGSDGMNINGRNQLACIIPLSDLAGQTIVIKPLSGMPVIRDLIVDMTKFYQQYEKIQPYLKNDQAIPANQERLQTVEQRKKLDGLYECVLCACCSSACPIYTETSEDFVGPAAMLQSARFILDNRDTDTDERIAKLDESKDLFKCRNILTCVDACPKGLDPNKAIADIHKKIME